VEICDRMTGFVNSDSEARVHWFGRRDTTPFSMPDTRIAAYLELTTRLRPMIVVFAEFRFDIEPDARQSIPFPEFPRFVERCQFRSQFCGHGLPDLKVPGIREEFPVEPWRSVSSEQSWRGTDVHTTRSAAVATGDWQWDAHFLLSFASCRP